MSKARLTYAGGKYAGKKIVDLLKSIKRVARNKKSKANIEKAGQGTKSVKKYNINLSEMTDANREHALVGNRKWYLRVKGIYRDFAETQSIKDGEELNQEFALIITIKDTARRNNVYDEVTRLLSQRNFYHSNIHLRQDVNIGLNGY